VPQENASDQLLESVTVRNVTRTSLNVRVPGQSLFVPPGETADVPRAYLETDELRDLLRQGALLQVEAPAPAAPIATATAASSAGGLTASAATATTTGTATAESKGSRSRKKDEAKD
jgi:hypothetical protein